MRQDTSPFSHVAAASDTASDIYMVMILADQVNANLTENAKEVLDLGCTLYERIRIFTEQYNEIGKNLNRAAAAYNKANGSLETRLLPAAKRFEALGVSKGDAIPELVEAEPAVFVLRAS